MLIRIGRQVSAIVAVFIVVTGLFTPAGATAGVGSAAVRPRALLVTSAGAGQVAALVIGRRGTLTRLGGPVAANPAARAVLVTPDGRFAYVGGQGDGSISTYAVRASGELTRLDERPFPVGGSAFAMAMGPGGRALYATDQTNDRVSAFAIGADGRLTALGSVPSRGDNPRGLAVAPDGRHVYVANGVRDTTVDNTLVAFGVRPDGSLEAASDGSVIGLGTGAFLSQIAITPDGGLLYAASQAGNQIWGFRVRADGHLSRLRSGPFPAPGSPEGVTLSPDGRHLYTASVRGDLNPDGANAVGAFRIRHDGGLEPVQKPVMNGEAPVAAIPSPDGRHLFVTNNVSSDVSSFEIDTVTGALRPIPGSPFKLDPGFTAPAFQSVAVTPNQGPVARFTTAQRPGRRTVTFDATSSFDPDGRIARFDWDFGDGTVRPDGGARPSHTYALPGTFTVGLTVTDNEGCSAHQIFTGQNVLCNGTATARFRLRVLVAA